MTLENENDNQSEEIREQFPPPGSGEEVVWKGKLVYSVPPNPVVDSSVVSVRWYNCFGSNLFPNKTADLQLAAGITSPHLGDGKTLVAANLATFLALDTQDETVLVDLNLRRPRLHQVFGVPPVPGIVDSILSGTVAVSRSAIKGLWVLPLGSGKSGALTFENIVGLRDVLSLLRHHFRFVIIDLPPALQEDFPLLVGNQLDGYFVVISTGKTKSTDIDRTVQLLNERKVIGFVMNRVPGGFLP